MKKLLLISLIILCSCGSGDNPVIEKNTNDKLSISEGIWGNINFLEGDFMPQVATPSGPNYNPGTITPIERELHIFEITTSQMVEPDPLSPGFFLNVYSNLVGIITSDATGFFELSLLPGTYSVFVIENEKYYANSLTINTDNETIISGVEVLLGETSKVEININYLATY